MYEQPQPHHTCMMEFQDPGPHPGCREFDPDPGTFLCGEPAHAHLFLTVDVSNWEFRSEFDPVWLCTPCFLAQLSDTPNQWTEVIF